MNNEVSRHVLPPRRSALLLACGPLLAFSLLLPACTPPTAQPRPTAATPPTPRAALECSSFSLLVNRDAATAAAVDPVETQIAVMQSRAFVANAPSWLAPSGTMSVERVGKSALIAVRVEAQPTRSSVVCDWLERRVLEIARPERTEASQWLAQQIIKLQHDADASQDELTAFDKDHDLQTVSLELQIDQVRDELKALRAQRHSTANDSALRAASERALRLNLQEQERSRLLRRANDSAHLLEALRERRATIELDEQLNRPIVLLDRCGPCAAP